MSALDRIDTLMKDLQGELEPLKARVEELENAIRQHRARQGRKTSWENDRDLYKAVGMTYPMKSIPSWQAFMTACAAYRAALGEINEDTEGVDTEEVIQPEVVNNPMERPQPPPQPPIPQQQPPPHQPLPTAMDSLPPHLRELLEQSTPQTAENIESKPGETREQFIARVKAGRRCRECGHADHTGRICCYSGPGQAGMCDCNDLQLGPVYTGPSRGF